MRKLFRAIAAILLVTMMLPLPQIVGANHRQCSRESAQFEPAITQLPDGRWRATINVGSEWDGVLFDGEETFGGQGPHTFRMFLGRGETHEYLPGGGTWYAVCYFRSPDIGPVAVRVYGEYLARNPGRWVQLWDMRDVQPLLALEQNHGQLPAPVTVSPAPAPVSTPSCAIEQFFPPLESGVDGLIARNIRAPHEGWWGAVFDGQVRPGGPQIYGILGVFTPEVRYVQGTWWASQCDPGPVATEMARARNAREPGLSIEVWEGREGRPRLVATFGPPAPPPAPAAPAPAPAAPGVTAVCSEESRELVPLLSQAWDGRVRAVVFPPVDFPTSGIVFEGLPWRDSPVHIELHRPQAMEVVYHSGTFRAVCIDPMTIAQRLWEVHRIAGRWTQVWDVRPSGRRMLIVEFNRPPHIPSAAAPTAPAQCLEPTPSRRGIPPESGDDLAFDLPVLGPAVVQVQWSGLVARPTWAQDRTVLTVVPHQWEGIFQKVRNVTVWSFSPLCSPEHVNRELARAAERSGFEIRGIEEIRGSGLFVKTIKTN